MNKHYKAEVVILRGVREGNGGKRDIYIINI